MSDEAGRREFLRAATAAGITGGLAGCSGDNSDSGSTETPDGTATGTPRKQSGRTETSSHTETEGSETNQSLDSEEIHRMLGDRVPSFWSMRPAPGGPERLEYSETSDPESLMRRTGTFSESLNFKGGADIRTKVGSFTVRIYQDPKERVSEALGVESGEITPVQHLDSKKSIG